MHDALWATSKQSLPCMIETLPWLMRERGRGGYLTLAWKTEFSASFLFWLYVLRGPMVGRHDVFSRVHVSSTLLSTAYQQVRAKGRDRSLESKQLQTALASLSHREDPFINRFLSCWKARLTLCGTVTGPGIGRSSEALWVTQETEILLILRWRSSHVGKRSSDLTERAEWVSACFHVSLRVSERGLW